MNEPYSHYVLSGVQLDCESFDLGNGASLSRTYVHLMAHPILAFKPAEKGKHSPGPWQNVLARPGTTSVNLLAELAVPRNETAPTLHHEWASWITFLLRFMTDRIVTMTLISPLDCRALANGDTQATLIEPVPVRSGHSTISAEMATWLKEHWYASFDLSKNDALAYAAASIYHSHRTTEDLGLVAVWAAFERLFSTNAPELKYRVCTNLAAFLEPAGEARYVLFKRLAKLYDDRSNAAHGSPLKNPLAYKESASLASRAILRIIELNCVPDKDYLERELLAPTTPRETLDTTHLDKPSL